MSYHIGFFFLTLFFFNTKLSFFFLKRKGKFLFYFPGKQTENTPDKINEPGGRVASPSHLEPANRGPIPGIQ